ncbi:MAG: hypothetical protein U0414_26015 [Polyangiaceae bacterium]
MSLARPESAGERVPEGTFLYRGTVALAGASIDLVARVSAADVELTWGSEPADFPRVDKLVRALLRAATRAELAQGIAPPRRVTRWREL